MRARQGADSILLGEAEFGSSGPMGSSGVLGLFRSVLAVIRDEPLDAGNSVADGQDWSTGVNSGEGGDASKMLSSKGILVFKPPQLSDR